MELEETEDACDKLPTETEGDPARFLAAFFYPLLQWSLKKTAEAEAQGRLWTQIFKANVDDGAKQLIRDKFNFRNLKQKACFLQPGLHEVSKHNGKLKTKYDRMILGMNGLAKLAVHFKKMKEQGVDMFSHLFLNSWFLFWCVCVSHLLVAAFAAADVSHRVSHRCANLQTAGSLRRPLRGGVYDGHHHLQACG